MSTLPPESQDDTVGEPAPPEVGALGRIVLRGAAFSSGGFALEQCLTLGAAVVLAHLVTPEEFGIYASATILLGYAAMFADSGLQSAVIHRRDRAAEAASTAFAANVVTGIALTVLAAGLAPVLGRFFHDSTITWVGVAMAATVALNSLMLIPDALLQREFSFVRRLFVSPSAALTFGVVAAIAAGFGLGVWSLVVGRYCSIVVELIVIWTLVNWRPRLSAMSISMWRSLAQYGRHIFAASFLAQSRTAGITALVGRFISVGAVGQLRYANTIALLPRSTWTVSSSYVVFPAFARIAQDQARFKAAFLRTLRWAGITTFPTSSILVPLAPSLVVLVLGEQWRQAGYAVMALAGFAITGPLASVLSEGLKGIGRPDVLSRAALVSTIGTIVLVAAFLPLGVVGVAGACSIGSLLTVLFTLKLALPLLGLEPRAIVRTLHPPMSATCAMLAVVFPLEWIVVQADSYRTLVGLLLLVGESVVGFAVYVVVLRLLDREAVETLWRAVRALGARTVRRPSAQVLS
jgi:O-antigen/teichoic acid export membrane protein